MRITNFDAVSAYAGQVLKMSFDEGTTWEYTRIVDHPHVTPYTTDRITRTNAPDGIPGDREQQPTGVHMVAPILDSFFKLTTFRLETTTAEEIAGRRFSYDTSHDHKQCSPTWCEASRPSAPRAQEQP